jgi:hypothetical protein
VLWGAGSGPADADYTSPGFLFNVGAVGFFLTLFLADKIHSQGALRRVQEADATALRELTRQHEAALSAQRSAHLDAMQRADDHVRALIVERDKANAERNEAVAVMRDFTLMAGAVLNSRPPWPGLPPAGEK